MSGRGGGTWRVVTGLLLFWLVVLLYMSSTLYGTGGDTGQDRAERQLARALHELDALKQQNDELHRLAEDLKDIRQLAEGAPQAQRDVEQRLEEANKKLQILQKNRSQGGGPGLEGPGAEHEEMRRKIQNDVLESWYFMRDQLRKAKQDNPANSRLAARVDTILGDASEYHRTLMTDLHSLSEADGAGLWREQEAKDLSDLVQRRLHYLQNPPDCGSAKKVVCNLNKGCGYGCQLHHLVYCFIIAYGTERTLILESRGWRYAPGGWETFFLPLSNTCNDRDGKNQRNWGRPADSKPVFSVFEEEQFNPDVATMFDTNISPNAMDNVQVIDLPIVDSLHPRPPYMPLAIPTDLAPRLTHFHGNPSVWWIGQFLKYLIRPQPELQHDLDVTGKKLGFQTPIVGVHVRRTDKVGTEAAFHPIEEYMVHVDEYYDMLEKRRPVHQRRVYLATDDPNVLEEAKQKFPSYEFIGDAAISQTAGLGSRYSESSLRGIILDIHFLSRTDFLVCTFSSQVCRVAYEIMQTYRSDAATYFYSLDDIYYFGGQNAHNQEAIYDHTARDPDELELRVGDLVGVAGNHWNGYSKGVNRRTGKTGLYPSYKIKDHVELVDFPTYDKVPLQRPLSSENALEEDKSKKTKS